MEDEIRPWSDEDERRSDDKRAAEWDLRQYTSDEEVPFDIPRD